MATGLNIEGLSAGYGREPVLRSVTLGIEPGELVTILGPSGCGKTTLLKVIAGLQEAEAGDILLNGESLLTIPAERRSAVMVFQKALLFPYLSVGENVGFGLRMRGLPKREITRRVGDALAMVRLDGYERRRPQELSGGEEQRISLARALVTEPQLLLLDEPFSALDERLRGEMRRLVREIQQRLRITTIFVTHDQMEASMLADRIGLMLGGRLVQFGPPRNFYHAPVSADVARFFGWQMVSHDGFQLAFRAERAELSPVTEADGYWSGTVEAVVDLGLRRRYQVSLEAGGVVEVETDGGLQPQEIQIGTRVMLDFPPGALLTFPPGDRAGSR